MAEARKKLRKQAHDIRVPYVENEKRADAVEVKRRERDRRRRGDSEPEDAPRAKKDKKGIFTRGKEWLFSGLKNEEEGEDVGSSERRLGYEALSEEDDSLGERESDIVRAIEDKKLAISAKARQAFALLYAHDMLQGL